MILQALTEYYEAMAKNMKFLNWVGARLKKFLLL